MAAAPLPAQLLGDELPVHEDMVLKCALTHAPPDLPGSHARTIPSGVNTPESTRTRLGTVQQGIDRQVPPPE